MNLVSFTLGKYQSNCYIIYKDFKAMIIDPGYISEDVHRFLEEKGLKVDVIYVTHGHSDHIGGVNDLKRKYPSATVYAPKKDMYWYSRNSKYEIYDDLLVDVYVKNNVYVPFMDVVFQVLETPGHTYGSTCLYLNKVLFSGDTLFRRSIGRTDLYMGDYEAITHSIQQILYKLPDDTVVYPGHGNVTTIKEEKLYNPFIKEAL